MEVMTQPVWVSFKELENPELPRLAERLPSAISHYRADLTVKKYSGGVKLGWVAKASSHAS